MKPIDKGSSPQLAGKNLEVKSYAEWRKHLIDIIGYYCSYCNIPLSHSLNVEHVVPKVPRDGENAGDYLQWENVLLACGPCNNKKGNNPIKPDQLYLPENNNTFISFQTVQHPDQIDAAIIEPAENLTDDQIARARRTINLLGLDEIDNRSNVVDIRWKKRKRAMIAAEVAFKAYQNTKVSSPGYMAEAARAVAIYAAEIGFF